MRRIPVKCNSDAKGVVNAKLNFELVVDNAAIRFAGIYTSRCEISRSQRRAADAPHAAGDCAPRNSCCTF